jgi:hypothetical protein
MHIIIGPSRSIQRQERRSQGVPEGMTEAKVLSVRPPRRQNGVSPEGAEERRARPTALDCASGQVLVLLVPEGHKIPKDVATGKYRVLLRFVPQRP